MLSRSPFTNLWPWLVGGMRRPVWLLTLAGLVTVVVVVERLEITVGVLVTLRRIVVSTKKMVPFVIDIEQAAALGTRSFKDGNIA